MMLKPSYPSHLVVSYTNEEVYCLHGDEDPAFIELTFFEGFVRKAIYERLTKEQKINHLGRLQHE